MNPIKVVKAILIGIGTCMIVFAFLTQIVLLMVMNEPERYGSENIFFISLAWTSPLLAIGAYLIYLSFVLP